MVEVTHYKATWSYKQGWMESGTVYYEINGLDYFDFSSTTNLSDANYKWGSVDKALQTLWDLGYTFMTQNFMDVQQFDSTW